MAKYYKVERFIKIQKIEKGEEDRVGSDWVEVNEDGSPIKKDTKKEEKKKDK
tara:strand:- start:352 stop:507 length:156 start_codon:yes stop_codon:yes gene_type:complete